MKQGMAKKLLFRNTGNKTKAFSRLLHDQKKFFKLLQIKTGGT